MRFANEWHKTIHMFVYIDEAEKIQDITKKTHNVEEHKRDGQALEELFDDYF